MNKVLRPKLFSGARIVSETLSKFSQPTPRIVISINSAWNIANFRGGLIRALTSQGYEVVAIAPPDEHVGRLEAMGWRFVPLSMDSKGCSPIDDARVFLQYLKILRREKPVAFLGFTIKPNVYGSLAAQALGIPVINNVSGLGTAFITDTWLTNVAKGLYKTALKRSVRVFFQNRDDRDVFVSQNLVRAEQTQLIPGSGIDLDRFSPRQAASPSDTDACTFLLIARLVADKGVREYVEAARLVRAARPGAKMQLLGFLNVANRTAISRGEVDAWVADGVVEYLGQSDDVRPAIAAADCIVLPSYREGTPRTLLEAAAMAKPIVATDVPGCREVVEDGNTGLFCRARDAHDLAAQMIDMIDFGPERRRQMGQAGRRKMERQFDEALVINAYLDVLQTVTSDTAGSASSGPGVRTAPHGPIAA